MSEYWQRMISGLPFLFLFGGPIIVWLVYYVAQTGRETWPYKIEYRATFDRWYVYEALGPFPLINWSWSSVASGTQDYCERWVKDAKGRRTVNAPR